METQNIDQAPQQSIEERIAAQFGIAPDQPPDASEYDGRPIQAQDEPEAEEVTPEPEEVEVEYDGATYRVPKGLEKAILQEKDYTQKTQSLAEQRRQIEHAQKALEGVRLEREFSESVRHELQQTDIIDSYLAQLKSVDVNSLPMEDGFKHWMQMQQLKEQRETLQKSIDGKRREFDSKVKAHFETLKTQARELLSRQVPGFGDETAAQLASHAKTLGYTDADWEMIQVDPRAATVLWKAMQFDKLQANKAEAVKTVTTPMVKPGSSRPMPQQVKDDFAFRKAMKSATTSQAKAKLIEQRLARSF